MRLAAIVLLVFGLAAAGVLLTLQSFNHFARISHQFDGRCVPVSGIAGPEDMAVDHGRGRVFVSSLDRRGDNLRGAIHLVDPADPLAADGWRDMTGGEPKAFRPLGVDYYEDGEVRRLFVVNDVNNAVEIFDVGEDGALLHLETLAERRMTSPNNIAAVGARQFYVTNDVRAGRNTMMGKLHFLVRATNGDVLYYDGVAWRIAATGLRFANGIAVGNDGENVYVAETADKSVKIFSRRAESGMLTPVSRVRTQAAPDNLSVDADGAVWAAGMPKPLALPRHAADAGNRAASAVMRIAEDAAETVYLDDGGELSAATTAVRLGDDLMIGALYEHKFLLCELPGDAF